MDDQIQPPPDHLSNRSAAALRDLEARAQEALAANREHVSRLEAEITRQLEQIAAALKEHTTAESQDAADAQHARAELNHLTAELKKSRANWDAERTALEAAREEFGQQVVKLEAQQCANKDDWQKHLTQFEEKLAQQQAAWSEQRSKWSEERDDLERARGELRQKFELALEDVQRFRARVAELEQELASRPEANQGDSAELIALRAERDALSERVEQLERQPAAQPDANSEQQLADLQRRFELAVEDVRELKTRNAKLEAQLASAGNRPAAAAEAGGSDWESQKRRLLASLEDDGEDQPDSLPAKERMSIENTIEMTDAIVAEKDREIAELKERLASRGEAKSAADEERKQKIAEFVDADEVVAQHRKRAAELEREMEQKLRTAELELSVERAKMARQKSELEDMKAELEAQQNAYGEPGANSAAGVPRRRWLSKLGLSSEEQ